MKIMKYTLWATVGLSLLFASCESILDINPEDRLTTKDYFTNEEQLQLYSNQFYSNNFPGDGDIYRDDADMLIVSPLSDEVSGQRVIPETGGGWSWSALRSINFLLDNLGNCKDQKVRDKYEALARFFRAYFYFEKVKDRTTLRVDYSDYEKDASLKGEFIRMVLGSELSQEQKAEVIRCGILALSGEEI